MSRLTVRTPALLALTTLALLPTAVSAQTPSTWRVAGQVDDGLGSSFDTGYDLDGDGVDDFLVGLPTQHAGASFQAGRAQVLSGADPSVVLLELLGDVTEARFGQSVAWMGDLDADGVPDLAVGAPGSSANAGSSGAFVSIRSGADGSELRRLSPPADHLYDGGFEQAGASFGHPWNAVGTATRSSSVVAGMPVSGQSYLRLSTNGSAGALPPSTPGGFGSLPVGANSVSQDFRYGMASSVLQGTAVFATAESSSSDPENDFMSVDVSADGLHRNVLVLDTTSSLPADISGMGATDPVPFSVDLAEAFPDADTDTVFTLTISVGNLTDGVIESIARVDDLRLVGGGLAPTAGATEHPGGWFGWSLANVGDLSGDGVADLAVGSPGTKPLSATEAAGSVLLYSGADGELLFRHDGGAGDSQFGSTVAAAGDADGDDVPDTLVGSRGVEAVGGALLSGATGLLLGSFSEGTPSSVSRGADLDGDGLADWVSGERENNQLRLLGSGGGPLLAQPLAAVIAGPVDGDLGASVDIIGDVDGDGSPDIAAGSPGADGGGLVTVYSGRTARELFSVAGAVGNAALGTAVVAAGDVNHDGFADLLVGDPGAALGAGELQLVHGGNPWHAAPGLRLDMIHDGGAPHVMSLTAGAGEVLTLSAKAAKKSGVRPLLRVLGPLPDETEVFAAVDSAKSDTLAIAKLTLEAGGDYRIEIMDDSGEGGRYAFKSRSKPAKVKQPLLDGAGGDLDLPLGKLRIQGTLETGETHRTGFTARRGTQLSVQVITSKQEVIVPGLRLIYLGAEEQTLFESPATQDKKVSVKAFELPAHGEYALEVFSQVVTGGDYQLRTSVKLPKEKRKLEAVEPPPGSDED